jgi:ATP-dependent RNA helicase DDX49/DBP8
MAAHKTILKGRQEATLSDDALTMDDLMRMQEARPHKRMRLDEDTEVSSGSGSGSDDEGGFEDEGGEDIEEDREEEEQYSAGDHPHSSQKDFGTVSRVSATASAPKHSITSPITATTWTDMNISGPLQTALASMSIRAPTEIQSACIPPLLSGELSCLSCRSLPDSSVL